MMHQQNEDYCKKRGHHFRSYLVKEKSSVVANIQSMTFTPEDFLKYIDMTRNVYEIRCIRCGIKTE